MKVPYINMSIDAMVICCILVVDGIPICVIFWRGWDEVQWYCL